MVLNINWELQGCCRHNQVVFIAAVGVSTVVILAVSPPAVSTSLYVITC
jgi:hypothetical protein